MPIAIGRMAEARDKNHHCKCPNNREDCDLFGFPPLGPTIARHVITIALAWGATLIAELDRAEGIMTMCANLALLERDLLGKTLCRKPQQQDQNPAQISAREA